MYIASIPIPVRVRLHGYILFERSKLVSLSAGIRAGEKYISGLFAYGALEMVFWKWTIARQHQQ